MTKKDFLKGIEIPVECGKAELVDHIMIMFCDMNGEQCGKKYNLYITEEDYIDKKPLTSFIGNIEPFVHFYKSSEHPEGEGTVDWMLGNDKVVRKDGEDYAFVVSKLDFDFGWLYTSLSRDEYLSVVPKTVLFYDDRYYVEKE